MTNFQVKVQAQTKTKAQTQAKTQAQTQAQTQTQTKAQTQAKTQAQTQAHPSKYQRIETTICTPNRIHNNLILKKINHKYTFQKIIGEKQ